MLVASITDPLRFIQVAWERRSQAKMMATRARSY